MELPHWFKAVFWGVAMLLMFVFIFGWPLIWWWMATKRRDEVLKRTERMHQPKLEARKAKLDKPRPRPRWPEQKSLRVEELRGLRSCT